MNFQIIQCYTGMVLFETKCDSRKGCVEKAIKDGAYLGGADLCGADLRYANLGDANLGGAYLGGAYLGGANLGGADLRDANLGDANLGGANLGGADLRGAYLGGADLGGAYLGDANLGGANLRGADLRGAYLDGANLRGADLRDANLGDAQSLHQQRITPSEGAFVGWKKLQQGVIAKLVIPSDAERVSCYGSRKCRASKVYVHEMYLTDGTVFDGTGIANYNGVTHYVTGQETSPDRFDPDPRIECSHGIHFFITREEAEEY